MNKTLKKVGDGIIVLLVLLIVGASYIQVAKGAKYRDDPRNTRILLEQYSRRRGQITAGAQVLAVSKPATGQYRYKRIYPRATAQAFANITGYYSLTYSRSGLELGEDSVLGGDDERLFGQRFLDTLSGRDPRGGAVVTTIDPRIQLAGYHALQTGCGGKGCRGAAVAIEPSSGKILAMVSTPSYDPNLLVSPRPAIHDPAWAALQKNPGKPLIDRAVDQVYPPGSTFKVLTTAAALEEGLTPATRLTAASAITLPNTQQTLTNYGSQTCPGARNGTVSLLQAFQYSCNTAFVDLATHKMPAGPTELRRIANAVGIDEQPDYLPLEIAKSTIGSIPDEASFGQSAIGQRDVALTPLQNAMIAATVANHGVLMKPYMVQTLERPDLSPISVTKPSTMSQVFTPQTATTLTNLMIASETKTSGYNSQLSYTIASKTGTAEHGRVGYDAPHGWYIAFTPDSSDSRRTIAVAVIVENGGNLGQAGTGGALASPIGRAMIAAAQAGQG